MDGIHYVAININGVVQKIIQGWTELKQKIIRLMGKPIMQIYNLDDNVAFSSEGSLMRVFGHDKVRYLSQLHITSLTCFCITCYTCNTNNISGNCHAGC